MKKLIFIFIASILSASCYSQMQMWYTNQLKTDASGFLQTAKIKTLNVVQKSGQYNINNQLLFNYPVPYLKFKKTFNFGVNGDDDKCLNLYVDAGSHVLYGSGIIDDYCGFTAFDIIYDSLIWWDKISTWNGRAIIDPLDMTIDSSGFLVTAGGSFNPYFSGQDWGVIKYDKEQQKPVWIDFMAGDTNLTVPDIAYSVTCDRYSDLIVTGFTQRYYYNLPHHFLTICKISGNNGDIIWKKDYGNIAGVGGNAVIDNQNNIYVVGDVQDSNEYYSVIKLSPDGREIWRRSESGIYNTRIAARNIMMTDNNDSILYVCGYSHLENSPTRKDFAVAKIDKDNGNILWVNSFNGLYDSTDVAYYLTADEQNNVYAAGTMFNAYDDGFYLTKIAVAKFDNETGDIEWKHTFNFTTTSNQYYDAPKGIVYDDGHVIVTGYTYVDTLNFPEFRDVFTVKIDVETGDIYWLSIIDDDDPSLIGDDFGYALALDPDTKDIFVGGSMAEMDNHNDPEYNYFLARLSYDIVGVKENRHEPKKNGKLLISPNPVKSGSSVTYYVEKDGYTEMNVLNLNETVRRVYSGYEKAGKHSYYWHSNGLSRGIYILQVKTDNGKNIYTEKVIVK